MPDVDKLIARNTQMKNMKTPWLPLYQALAMYVFLRKQYFTIDYLKTPFMLNFVFDSTAIHAAHMMAASLVGQILPNPFESFEFVPEIASTELTDEDYDFFQTVNEVIPSVMSLPEANTMPSLYETILDMGVFGIGSWCVDETDDYAAPVRFSSSDAKVMSVDENQYGQVDTVYLEKMMRVVQIVEKYGYDNCSQVVQKKYMDKEFDTEIKVLQVIEPRRERDPMMLGALDMPYASIHIELDQRHILLESGYNELPVIVARFWKNSNEIQGRSPAMDALPDIRAVNKLVEIFERAGEMGLDPPRMISSEDVLGAGKTPWGPGVEIPVHTNSRLGTDRRPPIEIIQTMDNPSWATQRISDLRDNIREYFMIDYLTDLNNKSRQTLGEADIRNEKGMYITGSVLNRVLVELLGPALDRAFNILLAKGFFGVIRGSVQDARLQAMGIQPKYISSRFIQSRIRGARGYRLNFISPAARLMKLEEAKGLQDLLTFATALAQIKPDSLDVLNADEMLRGRQRLNGASQKMLNTPDQVQQIRQARAQQQAQQQQQQQQLTQAHALKLMGAGAKDLANAGTTGFAA
ncbi:MAG: hypothetical protein KGI50_06050 [Patescibacteria group bacterium]|nr:hypothetical protein [Patescibacteria group bacterium]